MRFFNDMFGTQPPSKAAEQAEEAVFVHLDGVNLPDSVYEECDTSTIEDRLTPILERQQLGYFDGTETGPAATTLFMYGPDGERLFAGIEQTLRDYPLCHGARVSIRGRSSEREFRL
ncbi:MAG: hypothetical protein QOJ45_281 [Verrucomicrobiota bacterium]|jgi:hypothetical protein